jgi:hypothetical protein
MMKLRPSRTSPYPMIFTVGIWAASSSRTPSTSRRAGRGLADARYRFTCHRTRVPSLSVASSVAFSRSVIDRQTLMSGRVNTASASRPISRMAGW